MSFETVVVLPKSEVDFSTLAYFCLFGFHNLLFFQVDFSRRFEQMVKSRVGQVNLQDESLSSSGKIHLEALDGIAYLPSPRLYFSRKISLQSCLGNRSHLFSPY